MLNTGQGGVDWSGLGLAVELFGVDDVPAMIERLLIIKGHKPPKPDDKTTE